MVGIDLKKWHPKFWHVQNPPYNRLYTKKSTKMYWYVYNNTVPLLNVAKTWIFYPIYNFKIFKFSTISSASLPAIRPSSTSAMAPDFSHKKGNRV